MFVAGVRVVEFGSKLEQRVFVKSQFKSADDDKDNTNDVNVILESH